MNFQQLFAFLHDLQANNSKSWMDENRKQYKTVRTDFVAFLDELNVKLAEKYPEYTETPGKRAIERINNNLMFHPERPTYKDHFGGTLDKALKNSDFYFSVGVNEDSCCVAGGVWHPDKEQLNSIREAIDYNGEELKKIINEPIFKATYGGLYQRDTLKTAPQNYSKNHPHIDLLRLKSFAVVKYVTPEEIMHPDFQNKLMDYYGVMLPFLMYLRKAVTV